MKSPVIPKPCRGCPFSNRGDAVGLDYARRAQIARDLGEGQHFHCHETVSYDGEDGEADTSTASLCAGAVAIELKDETPNQLTRIMMRLGSLDPDEHLERCADLVPYGSFTEWLREAVPPWETEETAEEHQTCSVVGPECAAPAGYMVGGSVVHGDVFVDDRCPACGDPVCEACITYEHDDSWHKDTYICLSCAGTA